jgi:hypothetical protein
MSVEQLQKMVDGKDAVLQKKFIALFFMKVAGQEDERRIALEAYVEVFGDDEEPEYFVEEWNE